LFIRQQYGAKADVMMYNYSTNRRYKNTINCLYRERKPIIDKLTELRQSKENSIEEMGARLEQSFPSASPNARFEEEKELFDSVQSSQKLQEQADLLLNVENKKIP